MHLISCGNCGIVLDLKRLPIPELCDPIDGTIDIAKAVWDGDDYVATIDCPLCKKRILHKNGDKVR